MSDECLFCVLSFHFIKNFGQCREDTCIFKKNQSLIVYKVPSKILYLQLPVKLRTRWWTVPRFILFICSTELCISTRRCFIGWRLRYDGIFCHFKANPGECRMYVSKLGDSCGLQSQPSTRAPCKSNLQSDPYLLPNCCHVTIRHSNLIERTCSYVVRNRMNGFSVYLLQEQ